MKILLKILLIIGLVIILEFLVFKLNLLPLGCKKVNQTYLTGKERCCFGLDVAPTNIPNKYVCLPKLRDGGAY